VTTVHADVDVLRQLPIFSELSLGELRALHAIGERTTYAPGATIIEQDRPASLMLVMLKGTVVVTHVDERGGEAVLGELGYGAPIGEMALVDEGPTSARVRAKTDVAVFRWPMESLRRHLSTNERTTLRILRVMSRTLSVRLRETNARVIAAPAGRA
jgi:CRP-like cAMP-binding protein